MASEIASEMAMTRSPWFAYGCCSIKWSLVCVACLLSTGLSAGRSELGLVAGAAGAGFRGWIILCCSVRLFVSLDLIVSDTSDILQIFTTFISYFLAFFLLF